MKVIQRLMASLFGRVVTPSVPTFRYKYLRNPFDSFQYFSVSAGDQTAANKIATEKYTEMFNKGQTVMTNFWPM